jgi:phospholipid-binding lipoprotein MlaA
MLVAIVPATASGAEPDPLFQEPDPLFQEPDPLFQEPDPLFQEPDPLFDEFDEEFESSPAGFPDPLEETNRGVLVFNRFMDRWLLDPLTRVYGFIFPSPVKRGIRHVFQNLGEPATTVNNVMQLEWKDAGVSFSRFLINTTVGLAGIFDPASKLGLPYHRSDFGQTLALAGTPSGAYTMLPLFGPNNVRDGFGVAADFTMHPLTWFLGPTNFLLYGIYGGGQGISLREEALAQLDALREGSVDYYAALRNAYYQNRQAQIWNRRAHRRDDWAED